MFHRNCGKLDRIVRLTLGAILLPVSLFVFEGLLGQITLVISLLWLVTGASGFCVFYVPFGFSTLEKQKNAVNFKELT
jgi:hypothetical protein